MRKDEVNEIRNVDQEDTNEISDKVFQGKGTCGTRNEHLKGKFNF